MGRYAGQKRRATTSKIYAMDSNYIKALKDAKKIHRSDNEFYIDNIKGYYTSISIVDIKTCNYDIEKLEHWIFDEIKNRWINISLKAE